MFIIFNTMHKPLVVSVPEQVEEAMEQGYTVMDITKIGEGFSLSYEINPIE